MVIKLLVGQNETLLVVKGVFRNQESLQSVTKSIYAKRLKLGLKMMIYGSHIDIKVNNKHAQKRNEKWQDYYHSKH